MRLSCVLLIGILAFSCTKHPREVREALKCSGDNRNELEKVLDHYTLSGDEQKLCAARFLIANMPGHISLDGDYMDKYIPEVKKRYPDLPFYLWTSMYTIPHRHAETKLFLKPVEDIKNIKADYLISHIDQKFELWRNMPWGKDISFETFCEYLLPYRSTTEPIERIPSDSIYAYTRKFVKLAGSFDNCRLTIYKFKDYFMDKVVPENKSVRYSLTYPINNYQRDCMFTAYATQERLKLAGIPCAVDFTPAWPDYNGEHYWNCIFDPEVVQSLENENLVYRAAKVYRHTYSHHPHPTPDTCEYVPVMFRTPFIKDVTELYVQNTDADIRFNRHPEDHPEYLYLSLFKERRWQPVAWAPTKGRKASFRKLGVDVVYQPVYYNGEREIIADYPFHLTMDKKICSLVPDRKKPITLRLTRKFPINTDKLKWNENLVGAWIEAADNPKFNNAVTIGRITEASYGPNYILKDTAKLKYRYWRLKTDKPMIYLAELSFRKYDGSEIVGTPVCALNNVLSVMQITEQRKQKDDMYVIDKRDGVRSIFDDDVLSYSPLFGWVGMDMGKPVEVAKIICTPRNDENYICPGDFYELFYADREGWVSAGRKKATNSFIEFENVPSGALYWLCNQSKGREERPFTYENGKVVFR